MTKQLNCRYRVAVLLSAACYPKPIWLVIRLKATGCKAARRFQVASNDKPPPVRPNQRLPENPRSKTQGLAVDYLVRIVVMRRPADGVQAAFGGCSFAPSGRAFNPVQAAVLYFHAFRIRHQWLGIATTGHPFSVRRGLHIAVHANQEFVVRQEMQFEVARGILIIRQHKFGTVITPAAFISPFNPY